MKQSIDSFAAGTARGPARRHAHPVRRALAAAIAAAFSATSATLPAPAWAQLPTGGAVVHGSAAIATDGSRMTVTNSPNAVLNWQAFSIGAQSSVHFAQQGAASQVLNRVVGNDPSAILGGLSSNGGVWLINPHGVLFGANARIDVGGLVASTLPVSNEDFLAGRFRFDGGALPGAKVLNQGEIRTSFGGRVWLLGDAVRNEGLVQSPGGQIVLAAGKSVELVDSGMPNLTVKVTAPDNAAVNLGTLLASSGGSIDVHGGIVNQQGIVRADSIGHDAAGRVVIRAQGDVQLGAGSVTSAAAAGSGTGGNVLVASSIGATRVQGQVATTSAGGQGGRIHLLGKQVGVYGHAQVDSSGATGADEVLVGGDYQGANPAVPNADVSYLGPAASLRASATATGDGGKVVVWGDRATRVFGAIEARGGPGGGNGGLVETSGHFLDAQPRRIDVGAAHGKSGTWLLDPGNITIIEGCCSPGGADYDDSGDLTATSVADNAVIRNTTITDALERGTNVIVRTGGGANTTQAGDIVVAADVIARAPPDSVSLRLEAHNDIVVNAGVTIASDDIPTTIYLHADTDGDGNGGIALQTGSRISTRQGGGIGLYGGAVQFGPAERILIRDAAIDAGTGTLDLYGRSIDVIAGSALAGQNVSVFSDALRVTDSTVTAQSGASTGYVYLFGTTGSLANQILLQNTVLTATGLEDVASVIQARQLDLINTRFDTTGSVDITATQANITLDSDLRAHDIGITAGDLSILGSKVTANAGRLYMEVSPVHGGSGVATVRDANLTATSGSGSGAGTLAVVADNLELTHTTVRTAGSTHLLAPVITVAGDSDIAGGDVTLQGDRLDVADSRVAAVAGGVEFESRTAARDGSTVLRNVAVSAMPELAPERGAIGIHGDTVELADTDLRASGGVAIDGTATKIDNRDSDAAIRAAAISITAGTTRLDGVDAVASGPNTAIDIVTDRLTSRTSRLSTPAGRWLVRLNAGQSGFPAADLGDLDYTFVQVDAADAAPVRSGVGAHGILMADPLDVLVKVNAGRAYDGTVAATFSQALSHDAGTGFTVQQAEGNVTAQATFLDKNAGLNKPIAYEGESDYFIIRAPNGSRVYGADQSYVGDITPKAITLSGLVAANKVYDASRAATLSGSLAGIVEGDDATLQGATGLFDTKNVGTGKTVTIAGGTLGGADAANYTIGGSASTTADITPRSITAAGITAADKVYDGTRAAALTGTLLGALEGDDLRLDGSGLFDTKNVGAGKLVTVAGALAGADAGNYILTGEASTTADITPRPISANGIRALDKVYDGTRAATLTGTLQDAIAGDVLFLAGATGQFDDKNAGRDKPVTISGGTLGGADAGNYILASAPLARADITPRPITAAGVTAASKVYDGTRDATISGTLAEALAGDDVRLAGATGLFDTKNAGTGKNVALSGGSLAGVDAGNYRLEGNAGTTADITPRPIAATGITAADKVYDGTRVATLSGTLLEALPGDDVALNGATGLFDTKNAGVDKTVAVSAGSLAGADAGNYVLAGGATTRATITPRPVQIGVNGQVVKEYDATTAATLNPNQFVLNGVLQGDAVGVEGPAQGSFDSANVGQGKNVTVTGVFRIDGTDAANYRVGAIVPGAGTTTVTATASGSIGTITPATLVYTATPLVRDAGQPLDGLTGSVTGFKGTDSLATATSGTLVWQSPATTAARPGIYPVLGAGLAALNYVLVQAPGNAVALEVTPGNAPANPPRQAQENSAAAIAQALNAALPVNDPRRGNSGVLDISNPAVGRTYGAVRIGAMSQGELAQLIAQRRNFKRKLFADAIYKLDLDPRLADVQPCTTIVDAGSGACRLTPNQLDLIQGDTRLAALAGRLETTGSSAGGATGGSATAPGAVAASRAATAHVPQIQRKIAVLFGINDYADKTIPPLENAVPDVDAVSTLFAEKLGYEVRVVRNPTKADIIRTLNQLSVEIGSSDSVVIYYAGHGYSLEKNGAGYWLPADAQSSDPARWISNVDVAHLLSGIRSSQMVLISDSCYSGAFARDGMDAVGHDVTPEGVLAKRSVVVISSGGDEPVADEGKDGHSIFAWNLMQAMRSVSSWKPGSTVFNDVQAGVRKEFPQTPKYGSVTAAGHQAGGDYLFELR